MQLYLFDFLMLELNNNYHNIIYRNETYFETSRLFLGEKESRQLLLL